MIRFFDFFTWPLYLFIWPMVLCYNLFANLFGWPITLLGELIMLFPNAIFELGLLIINSPGILVGGTFLGAVGGLTYLF